LLVSQTHILYLRQRFNHTDGSLACSDDIYIVIYGTNISEGASFPFPDIGVYTLYQKNKKERIKELESSETPVRAPIHLSHGIEMYISKSWITNAQRTRDQEKM